MEFFFFKQKTAYEMRISDWSSDVCSSDLAEIRLQSSLDVLHHFRIEGRKLRRRRRRNVEAAGTIALAVRDIGQETARHLPVGANRIGDPDEALPARRFTRVKRHDRKIVLSGKSVSVSV